MRTASATFSQAPFDTAPDSCLLGPISRPTTSHCSARSPGRGQGHSFVQVSLPGVDARMKENYTLQSLPSQISQLNDTTHLHLTRRPIPRVPYRPHHHLPRCRPCCRPGIPNTRLEFAVSHFSSQCGRSHLLICTRAKYRDGLVLTKSVLGFSPSPTLNPSDILLYPPGIEAFIGRSSYLPEERWNLLD